MSTHIEFTGIEFSSVNEAIQHAEASGRGEAVRVGSRWYVADQSECDRLATAGVEFAYAFVHEMPDGSERVLTVPVNG